MSRRIVVADDEADIRRLVAFILKGRGHTVLEAGAGDEALALIRRERPDLVILDVMMPGLTGPEVVQTLRADGSSVPCLLISARGQTADLERGLASGACIYMVKPFVPRELADRVAELLAALPT
jgi:two-component system response regulator MtrA